MNKSLIALYDNFNNLVGYFHDEMELSSYLEFMKGRGINTDGWKSSFGVFKV